MRHSMTRDDFGNKEELYEEVLCATLAPLLELLDGQRLSSVAGDLLTAVPKAVCDRAIYLFSDLQHEFDDETCIRSLRNVADAAPLRKRVHGRHGAGTTDESAHQDR